ncbi:MAG: hypothetical protein ACRDH8_12920 [Actinomycetota bacterium]
MSIHIRTRCTNCGEQPELEPADVSFVVHADGKGRYTFTCPECFVTIHKDATAEVVAQLDTAGAIKLSQMLHPELLPDLRRGRGPLTEKDLKDFDRELRRMKYPAAEAQDET